MASLLASPFSFLSRQLSPTTSFPGKQAGASNQTSTSSAFFPPQFQIGEKALRVRSCIRGGHVEVGSSVVVTRELGKNGKLMKALVSFVTLDNVLNCRFHAIRMFVVIFI